MSHYVKRTAGLSGLRRSERGLTLLEVLVVVTVVAILASLVTSTVMHFIHKARLARCFSDLRSIQATLYLDYPLGDLPDPDNFWKTRWSGKKPGPYYYLVDDDGDGNKGHGNDLDGSDEQNSGKAPRVAKDIEFVLVCQHDHADLARYVYIEDDGPPTIAEAQNDPRYDHFIGK